MPPSQRELAQFVRPYKAAPATFGLVVTCVAVFLVQVWVGLPDGWGPVSPFSAVFHTLFILDAATLRAGFIWQPVTNIFLHGGFLHLLFNMLALGSTGPWVERSLGRANFLAIFFLGGIIGSLAQIAFTPESGVMGASGGVFAVMLALTTYRPDAKLWLLAFFIIPLKVRGRYLGWGLILGSVMFMILGLAPGIGHMAHLGGAIVGGLFAFVLRERRARARVLRRRRALVAAGLHPAGSWSQAQLAAMRPQPRLEVPGQAVEPFAAEVRPTPAPVRPVQPAYAPPRRPVVAPEFDALPRPVKPVAGGRAMGFGGLTPRDPALEALLDKVERQGLESLTPAEKRLLERGTR